MSLFPAPHRATLALLILTVTACQPSSKTVSAEDARSQTVVAGSTIDSPAKEAKENSKVSPGSSSVPTPAFKLTVEKTPFGKLSDGRQVTLFTVRNHKGLTLKMIDYGAIIVSLEAPDRDADRANVALGFDNLEGYLQRHPYFGATVGRYCNRIAGGKFKLDGKEYTLATNNGPNHLHGGVKGLDRVLWKAEPEEGFESAGIQFTYESPDGEEGYPGKLRVTATYLVNNDNELVITMQASTDKPTPVNLTNYCYWNLGGAGTGTILDHEITINADKYLPVDKTLIPTGEQADVAGTPFDFLERKTIGARIGELKNSPQGYDHCYVLRSGDEKMRLAARVRHPKSGRVMEIHTTQPAVQFYSGNFLDGQPANGKYPQYSGFCLETQHFPDSPNQPTFPNTILRPGEHYRQVTVFKFSTE